VEGSLSARTRALVDQSEAEGTRVVYAWGWEMFVDFCDAAGGRDSDGVRRRGYTALPASPLTLTEFVGHLAAQGYAPASIRAAKAGVLRMHRTTGHPVPDVVQANAALRGHESYLFKTGWRPDEAAPARTGVLEQLVSACRLDTHQGVRDVALLTGGYAMAARRRSLVNLNITDVQVMPDDGSLQCKVWQDKGGRHRVCVVPHWGDLDAARPPWCDDALCPACNVRRWLRVLSEHDIHSGPVFRPIGKSGNIHGHSPVGGHHMDARLSVQAVGKIFDRLVGAAGMLGQRLRPHSLRAGYATEGYEHGGDELALRRGGGWSDRSGSFTRYIRDVDQRRHNPLLATGDARRAARREAEANER
jgi:integrase